MYQQTYRSNQIPRLGSLFFFILCATLFSCQKDQVESSSGSSSYPTLESLGIPVSAKENRTFSFTDKQSGYFYGTTHTQVNQEEFSGWNIARNAILRDYQLYTDNTALDRTRAQVVVFPHLVQRTFSEATERFMLFDDITALQISLSDVTAKQVGISIQEDLCTFSYQSTQGIWFFPLNAKKARVLVAPLQKTTFTYAAGRLNAPVEAGGFLLIYGESKAEILETLDRLRTQGKTLLDQRWARMDALAKQTMPQSGQDSLDRSLAWLTLTLDQLITKQTGWGIYAGLPWFNDYWGRDLFVSLPGACLVSGQFDVARNILESFAAFQNTDKNSKHYGRIPNRARPDGKIYNTADGTPRFVEQINAYVNYSGDTSIIRTLYPAVKRSIEGALQYWVDEKGYLTHDDADTWMDAKIKGTTPYSPRGNRANDIQALWVNQLRVGALFARFLGDTTMQATWDSIASQVTKQFEQDFRIKQAPLLSDRLTREGKQDTTLRPNQLFALDLVQDPLLKRQIVRTVWEQLVYPWGVASLSQRNPDFHPYHEHWNYYHKDAAYHNGTVWLWLNGIAMQRMIEAGQPDIAYPLFKRMNTQALSEGAVGSLSENADAIPRTGSTRGKLSGTFLQAWSNAEQLRVWSQYFMGIQPDLMHNQIIVQPALPAAITKLHVWQQVGKGKLEFEYSKAGATTYRYTLHGLSTDLQVLIPSFPAFKKHIPAGATLTLKDQVDYLDVRVSKGSETLESFQIDIDITMKDQRAENKEFFKGVPFCKPVLQEGLKALRVYHDPPLTY